MFLTEKNEVGSISIHLFQMLLLAVASYVFVCRQLTGVGSGQMITTYDPRLNALGLPQYPPLPSNLDAGKVEEVRRTVYIGNLDPATVRTHARNFVCYSHTV
jgi:hypothetical protein